MIGDGFVCAGTNIQTNEEVAIKLVSFVLPIQLQILFFFNAHWLSCSYVLD